MNGSPVRTILLVNNPRTAEQAAYLKGMCAAGCSFIGFNRVLFQPGWSVHVSGEITLRMGTRSPGEAIGAVKDLRKAGIEEALIFFDRHDLAGRASIKFLMLLGGISVKGVDPEGRFRIFRKPEIILSILKEASLFNWLRNKVDFMARIWFLVRYTRFRAAGGVRREDARGTNEKSNVLLVTNSLGVGGIEIMIRELVRNLDKERYEPSVLIFSELGSTAKEIEEMGYKVGMAEENRDSYRFVRELCAYMEEERTDIVHYHGNHAESIPVRLAAALAGVPVIISHIHGTVDFKLGRWNRGSFSGLLERNTDRFIACSDAVRNFAMERFGYPAGKVTTIMNGVDSKYFAPKTGKADARERFGIPGTKKVMCVAARLVEEKGHRTLIQALDIIRDCCDFLCLVCGEGPLERELKTLVSQLGLDDRVLFMGARADLHELLDAVDLSVLPSSRFEGLPLVVLEAMAKGLPVVACDSGGTREVVVEGRTGFVVPPDEPRGLARALKAVLTDDVLMKAMGENGCKDATERYSSGFFAHNVEKVYEECRLMRGKAQ